MTYRTWIARRIAMLVELRREPPRFVLGGHSGYDWIESRIAALRDEFERAR